MLIFVYTYSKMHSKHTRWIHTVFGFSLKISCIIFLYERKKTYRWEKTFTNHTAGRGLIPKLHKVLKKLDIKKLNNSVKKWSTDLNKKLLTEESQVVGKKN